MRVAFTVAVVAIAGDCIWIGSLISRLRHLTQE